MNYCPECGGELLFDKLEPDVPTDHYHYHCVQDHHWVETTDKGGHLLHITEEEEGGD